MPVIEQILLGLALAMDCFSVNIASGLILKKIEPKSMITMAILFGIFQAVMPTIGWLGTVYLGNYIKPIDHWIAFVLLTFVGVKMIMDQFKKGEEKKFNPTKISVILLLSLATSIDALSIGVSFTCMDMSTFGDILSPIVIIGICSIFMSVIGNVIGVTLGKKFKFPAEMIGGIILMLIGIKVLVSHMIN